MILITVFSIALLIALAFKKDFLIAIPVVMTGVALVVRLFIFLNLYNELIILLCVATIGAIVLTGHLLIVVKKTLSQRSIRGIVIYLAIVVITTLYYLFSKTFLLEQYTEKAQLIADLSANENFFIDMNYSSIKTLNLMDYWNLIFYKSYIVKGWGRLLVGKMLFVFLTIAPLIRRWINRCFNARDRFIYIIHSVIACVALAIIIIVRQELVSLEYHFVLALMLVMLFAHFGVYQNTGKLVDGISFCIMALGVGLMGELGQIVIISFVSVYLFLRLKIALVKCRYRSYILGLAAFAVMVIYIAHMRTAIIGDSEYNADVLRTFIRNIFDGEYFSFINLFVFSMLVHLILEIKVYKDKIHASNDVFWFLNLGVIIFVVLLGQYYITDHAWVSINESGSYIGNLSEFLQIPAILLCVYWSVRIRRRIIVNR